MGAGHRFGRFLRSAWGSLRASAVPYTEWEARELEHLFALLALGSAAGIPGPPTLLSLDLLPLLEREILVLQAGTRRAGDPWGDLFSTFDVT